jgi:hypothetical protein
MDTRTKREVSKAVGQAVQQSFLLVDGLFDWVPVGLFICDAKASLLRYNTTAAKLWKVAPELGNRELGGPATCRLLSTNGRALDESAWPLAEALRFGSDIPKKELICELRDGSRFLARFDAKALHNKHGSVSGAVVAFAQIG